MPTDLRRALQQLVDSSSGSVLVLHDQSCLNLAGLLTDVHRVDAEAATVAKVAKRHAAVLCLMSDAAALRRLLPALRRLGRTRTVLICLREASQPIVLRPRRDWPAISRLSARLLPTGEALTTVKLSRPIPVIEVLEQVGIDTCVARPALARVVMLRNGTAVGLRAGAPPDTILRHDEGETVPEYRSIRAGPPVVVTDPDLAEGPVDEGDLNPIGFVRQPSRGLARLWTDGAANIRLDEVSGVSHVDRSRGATAAIVAALREHEGVQVSWQGADRAFARIVAGLAMAGVPVVGDRAAPDLVRQLGPTLCQLIHPARARSRLEREEQSVSLRREALLTHSRIAWRTRSAQASGKSLALLPSCSVVLATMRPEQLELALGQFSRQRGVERELILVAHGFKIDDGWLRERARYACTVVQAPSSAVLGDVLNMGLARASGDVIVKMDDDDYYGPDFLLDLLLARHYSGADLVGTAAEFMYLSGEHRTLRRRQESELFAESVAGGTIMVGREHLRELGGFPSLRVGEDQVLCNEVRTLGGSVYRSHGLGYVRRRSPNGHTWDPGLDYFLNESLVGEEWDGFVPSRLLEADSADQPGIPK